MSPEPQALEKAELYAALHRGNEGDVAFYVEACRGAARVLELGCGAGRVLGALAAAGLDVTGVEKDAAALALAAAALPESATLLEGDMGDPPTGDTRFDRVLIPYNGLYCLLDDDAALRCLRAAHARLAPGGKLLLDGYLVDPEARPEAVHEEPHLLTSLDWRGQTLQVFEESDWHIETQRLDVTYHYLLPEPRPRTVTITIPQRYLHPEQLLGLLGQAGFEPEALWGGFDGRPLFEGEELMVVEALRREDEGV